MSLFNNYILYINEDFLDDLDVSHQPTAAQDIQSTMTDVVYITGRPEDFRYYMEIEVEFAATWRKEEKDYKLNLPEIYDDLSYVCHSSMIDGKFYITPFYFFDEKKSKPDYDEQFKIEPIQMEFPYPDVFDFKDIYHSELRSSMNQPRISFRIYFDDICYYPYQTFISRWRMMMQAMDRIFDHTGIVKHTTMKDVQRNEGKKVYTVSNMYLSGYNHNSDSYFRLYKLFFDEVAPEYDMAKDSNWGLDRMFRRLHIDRIAKETERFNGEYGISVEYCQSEFRNRGDRNTNAWISFKIHVDNVAFDIAAAQNFLTRYFFYRIPRIFYHFVTFCVFLKSDFGGPYIYNSMIEYRKKNSGRRNSGWSRYGTLEVNRFEPWETHVDRLEYSFSTDTVGYKTKKDDRFLEYYFESMGSSDSFLIYYGDKNGKLGKKPFWEKSYRGWCAYKFVDVLNKIDDDIDIWQKS